MSDSDDSRGFTALPGLPSTELYRRSLVLMVMGLPFVVAIVFESALGSFEAYYAAAMLALVLTCVTSSALTRAHCVRKRKAEAAAGYTPWISTAAGNPGLFLVDRRTLEVISRPY